MNTTNEILPFMFVRELEDGQYGFFGLKGSKELFMRIGEFLAIMCDKQSYNIEFTNKAEDGSNISTPVEVELIPKDSDELDDVVVEDSQNTKENEDEYIEFVDYPETKETEEKLDMSNIESWFPLEDTK